jgi:3-polyprenyl-4-hydroxybenzoate decarboxylase
LVSFNFEIPNRKPHTQKHNLFLYKYQWVYCNSHKLHLQALEAEAATYVSCNRQQNNLPLAVWISTRRTALTSAAILTGYLSHSS